jgi:hypothetical protein
MASPIRWTAPEFHYYDKDSRWHTILGVGTVIIVVIALLQRNFLFAIFAVIAGLLLSTWGRKAPEIRTFTLTDKELQISGGKSYAHDHSEGFTIIKAPNHPPELALKTKKRLHNWLHVIIPEALAEQIQELLLEYLPEVEYQETIGDKLGRLLRF